MKKGDRVSITGGKKGVGVSGEIFWIGKDKFGGGERYGVRGDDGDTYWVSSKQVEAADGPAPAVEAGPTFAKGDRVSFRFKGQEGSGSVFWLGENRYGPGQRLGVRPDDSEEAVWLDSRFAEKIEGEAPAPSSSPAPAGDDTPWEDTSSEEADYFGGAAGPVDDGPPLDDAYLSSMEGALPEQDWDDLF